MELKTVLADLCAGAVYLNNSVAAFEDFLKYYNELKMCYEAFFPDVKKYAKEQLVILISES